MPTMEPVAQNINPPDIGKGLANVSHILGIKQQQQNLQTGLYQQQTAAAMASQEEQTARQRRALAKVPWTKYLDSNGITDTDKMGRDEDLREAAGDAFPAVLEQGNKMRLAQTQGKRDYLALNADQLGLYGQVIGGTATDPDVVAGNEAGLQKLINATDKWGDEAGPEARRLADSRIANLEKLRGNLPKEPNDMLTLGVRTAQLQANSAAKQLEITRPGGATAQTKEGLVERNVNPYATQPVGTQVGVAMPNATPPAIVQAPSGAPAVTGPGGTNPRVIGGGGGGSAQPGQPSPSSSLRRPDGHAWTADDGAPGAFARPQDQANWNQATTAAAQHVADTRAQDQNYGVNLALASNIRRLAHAGGPWSTAWKDTVVGAGLGNITDFNLLGAYLDNQAAQLQHSMGLPETNAGLSQANTIASKQKYSAEAIAQKTDYLLSLVEGQHAYRQALDRVEGYTGNPNPQTVRLFNGAWANNFDPRIMEGQAAYARGKKDGDEFMARLQASMPSRTAWDQFIRKRRNLLALEQGQLPQ